MYMNLQNINIHGPRSRPQAQSVNTPHEFTACSSWSICIYDLALLLNSWLSVLHRESCICQQHPVLARMASPVAVRPPLSNRSINTAGPSTTYKPLVGQKRSHSQITTTTTNGQENTTIQQPILGSFKEPSALPRHIHYTVQAAQKSRTTARSALQVQPQFKQPLPRTTGTARQREQTNDRAVSIAEAGESAEVIEWRRQMKRTLSASTFYFDGIEESFKEGATRIIHRHGGVINVYNSFDAVESRTILFEFG